MNSNKELYIVLSQTGTMFSRALKLFTGARYNHASVSISSDLKTMYSFGRKHPYNPFFGGFVVESIDSGTFKRFKNTEATVISVNISPENYEKLCDVLQKMTCDSIKYHYNFIGVLFAAFHKVYHKKDCYYCSEFVRDVLIKGDIDGMQMLSPIVWPIHFLKLPHKLLYSGRLNDYSYK